MNLETFISEKKFMDLKEFSLNTAYLGKDANNVYLKFLNVIQELNVKQVQYIVEKDTKLNFINNQGNKVTILNVDYDYKKRLISANVFMKDPSNPNIYIKTRNAENYISILQDPKNIGECKIPLFKGGEGLVLQGVSYNQPNFIKTRAYHKGNICLLKMPEAILKSYYVYTSLDNVKNNFVITNQKGQKHACGILEDGLYLI